MPTTSPVRVSGSSPARWATPKSVSLAAPSAPSAGASGTITFCGLTSRWMTPRSWACASASASASPIRSTSRSDERAVGARAASSVRPRPARRPGSARRPSSPASKTATIPGWSSRAAASASRWRALADAAARRRDHLDRDVAVQALVARRVDRAEAAGAEPRAEPVAAEDERRRRPSTRRARRGLHQARAFGAPRPVPPPRASPQWRDRLATGRLPPTRTARQERPDLVLLRRGRRAPHDARRAPAPRRGRSAAASPTDPQTLLVRRAIAASAASCCSSCCSSSWSSACRDSRHENALQGLQPRGLVDRRGVRPAGRRAVLPAARPGRRASRRRTCRPAISELPRAGRAAAQAGAGPRRARTR